MKKLPVTNDIDQRPVVKCPHCDNEYDFYTKQYISGSTRYYYRFDGEEAYNGEMYDHLDCRTGKIAYCSECDKAIFRIAEGGARHG